MHPALGPWVLRRCPVLFAITTFFLHWLPAQAQPLPTAAPATQSLPAQPTVVQVELRLGDGTRTAYHIGELIPVHLSFSTKEAFKRRISTERCESDEIYPEAIPPQILERRDAESTAARQFSICSTHGWTADIDLSVTPYLVELLLNRVYKLDTPGTYQLRWTGKVFGDQVITSNTVTLTLLPRDPAWEASELARADTLIGLPPGKQGDGCIILRYLGTPSAEIDMARRYGTSRLGIDWVCDDAYAVALINSPQRDEILSILQQRLTASDQVIPYPYLRTLALISLYHANPEWYEQTKTDLRNVPNSQRTGPVWDQSLLRSEELHYAALLANSLPNKAPPVRARCVESLLEYSRATPNTPLPQGIYTSIQQQMPSVFRTLDDFDQHAVLENLWPQLSGPAMVPLLVDLVENDGGPVLRGLALRRLNELAPQKARAFIVEDLKSPRSRFPIEDLGILSDADLPELDGVLLQRATDQLPHPEGADLHGTLILLRRYASPAIEPQVRNFLETNFDVLDCGERFDFLDYLHRVNPHVAETFVKKLNFDSPLTACSIHELATRFWSPTIEAAELARLDSPTISEVRSALSDLEHNASPAARPVILHRFELWSSARKSNAESKSQQSYTQDDYLDSSFLNALIFAFGWNSTQQDIVDLGKLCITSSCKNEAEQRVGSFPRERTFIVLGPNSEGNGKFNYGFAPYGGIGDLTRMQQKLSQFPPHTAFSFDTRRHSQFVIQRVLDTLGVWMTEHGYTLTLYREGS